MDRIPKNIRETHSLGARTREWMVSSRQVPGFGATRTRIAGYTEARAGYEFVRFSPAFSVILVSAQGEGRALVDGAWRRFPPGYAYITAPRALNAFRIAPGGHWRLHWVLYEESASLPTLEPGRKPRLIPVDGTGFRFAVEGLCYENAGKADQAVMGFWAALVDRMVWRILESEMGEPRLDQLWLAIREDVGGTWNLRRMARCIGMSEENLRRLCHRHVHRSPMSHLTSLRMLAAADLLCHSTEKIASIATRVGYGDGFSFSTAFKREMKMPPKRFRAANRPEGIRL
jgi:AraC-like DNA-binding protein